MWFTKKLFAYYCQYYAKKFTTYAPNPNATIVKRKNSCNIRKNFRGE